MKYPRIAPDGRTVMMPRPLRYTVDTTQDVEGCPGLKIGSRRRFATADEAAEHVRLLRLNDIHGVMHPPITIQFDIPEAGQ